MGEMFAYYAASDVAIIGGSLLPFGAQNLIEACAAGCPVVVGPHIYNFSEVVQLALEAGAAVSVDDAPSAVNVAGELLRDSARARRMGEAGLAFTRDHRGAAGKVADLLKF
jgi:3-deoxy-D-manno-octulosonic-acid transferase